MNVRRILLWLLLIAAFWASYWAFRAQAQTSESGLLSTVAARRFGLERSWFTQVELDGGRGVISNISYYVSNKSAVSQFEVVWETGGAVVVSPDDPALDGKPLGPAGAQLLATRKLQDLRLLGVPAVLGYTRDDAGKVIYQITYEPGEIAFSERDRNTFGEMVGKDKANAAAIACRKELIEFGFDAKGVNLVNRVVPETYLYVTTSQGVTHAINAETGETVWSQALGRIDHPNEAPGMNEDYLGVVNGSMLFIVDRATGKQVWSRKLGGVPGAGPALSREFAFVPLINGLVESYRLNRLNESEQRYQHPQIYVSIGKALLQPIVTPYVVAWATDRGFLYRAFANQIGLRDRTEASDTVVARPSYMPAERLILMASVDGFVYAIQENSGDVFWRFSTGQPLSSSPVPTEGAVYVIGDDGVLFKINAEDGSELWSAPRAYGLVAASPRRVYATDRLGRMMILDAATGGLVGMLDTLSLDVKFINTQSDRLFLGTSDGLLQCFHEADLEYPVLHSGLGEAEEENQVEVKPADEGMDDGGKPKPIDPFGDPFGGDAPAEDDSPPPAAPSDDPFGDPFK